MSSNITTWCRNMSKKDGMETVGETQSNKWFFPPSLEKVKVEFLALLTAIAQNHQCVPLMIMGDTGVGKSAFVQLFEDDFLKRKPGANILRINVASLPETLIEAELFGHVRGAFTGAIKDRKGLIGSADLLILEEIGELRQHVQAKLLTFIEDGYFYPIGANEPKKAQDVQIVATTNRIEKDMRPDFYHRFFHFEIPPLCRRRTDVLHYLHHFSPATYQELRPWEIMTLLCHNWPGNVREIETLSREISWGRALQGTNLPLNSALLGAMSITTTGLSTEPCRLFRNSLEMNGIDVKFLEKVLNEFGLGLHFANRSTPLRRRKSMTLKGGNPNRDRINDDRHPMATLPSDDNAAENRIRDGLRFFAELFWKDECGCENLLKGRTGSWVPGTPSFRMIQNFGARHMGLVRDCLRYINIPERPGTKKEFDEYLRTYQRKDDPIPEEIQELLPVEMQEYKARTERDILRDFYKRLIAEEKRNLSAVARRADVKRSTLDDRLRKLGLK